jgi:hypothetical protein
MDRNYWAEHVARLDPETEYEQIYRIMVTHEFPWDMNQSLSFASLWRGWPPQRAVSLTPPPFLFDDYGTLPSSLVRVPQPLNPEMVS